MLLYLPTHPPPRLVRTWQRPSDLAVHKGDAKRTPAWMTFMKEKQAITESYMKSLFYVSDIAPDRVFFALDRLPKQWAVAAAAQVPSSEQLSPSP